MNYNQSTFPTSEISIIIDYSDTAWFACIEGSYQARRAARLYLKIYENTVFS